MAKVTEPASGKVSMFTEGFGDLSAKTDHLEAYWRVCREAVADDKFFLTKFREMQAYADIHDFSPPGVDYALRSQRLRSDLPNHMINIHAADLLGGMSKGTRLVSGIHLSVGTWRRVYLVSLAIEQTRPTWKLQSYRPLVLTEIGCGHGASAFVADSLLSDIKLQPLLGKIQLFDHPAPASLAKKYLRFFRWGDATAQAYSRSATIDPSDVVISTEDMGKKNHFELAQLAVIFTANQRGVFLTSDPERTSDYLERYIGGSATVCEPYSNEAESVILWKKQKE